MNKSRKTALPSGIANQVMGRLKAKTRPERTKRTLVLTKATYDQFEKFCRSEGTYPSDVIDEFIAIFVEERISAK